MRKTLTAISILMIISLVGCSLGNQQTYLTQTGITEPSLTTQENSTPLPLPSAGITSTNIATSSPNPQNFLIKGDEYLFNGDYENAWYEYSLTRKESDDSEAISEAIWGLSRVEYLRENYDQSLAFIQDLQANFPDTTAAKRSYFLQGQDYDQLQLYLNAADSYSSYLRENPGVIDSFIHEVRGDSLSNGGNYQEAINEYQASIDSGGDSEKLSVEIGKLNKKLGNYSQSIEIYQKIYSESTNDYLKAQMDYLIGEIYYSQGLYENAYPYFQDTVVNYPVAYDSYSSLITLINDGVVVDDYNRGLVDYFAGQYGLSLAAFNRYIEQHPDHDGTVIYYQGMVYRELGDYQSAVDQWNELINDYPENRYWDSAWDERAYTLWGYMDDYKGAAQSLLDYVDTYPTRPNAPFYLNSAARIYERGEELESASSEWLRLANDYPESELVSDALFNSGIVLYRLKDFNRALVSFQKNLIFSNSDSIQARTYLWIGKTQTMLGETDLARQNYQLAAGLDPSDYYSQRAISLLNNQNGFASSDSYDFSIDFEKERVEAETWLRITFSLPQETMLSGLGELSLQENIIRGTEFWKLGLYNKAINEFNLFFTDHKDNPVDCYRFANYLHDLGSYRLAVIAYRQVLYLAGMETYTQMLNAPSYFIHMNYGPYFLELINSNSALYNIDPAVIMSLIVQESGFDAHIQSSAGAIGLMQIVPTTGESISSSINWPVGYKDSDLIRPMVNIRLGSAYLEMNLGYFDGDLYASLAAYNAGPGNVNIWKGLSGPDPDLFLEVVRYSETRNYLENIYEIFQVYKTLYGK